MSEQGQLGSVPPPPGRLPLDDAHASPPADPSLCVVPRPVSGRKRWIVYSDIFDYSPSSIPSEWHGWLNYINDYPPTTHTFTKSINHVEAFKSPTGAQACME